MSMDPDQLTQVFNRCPGCGMAVTPSDAACPRCGRRLGDAAAERTMVLPRVSPTDGSLASPQTTMPLPTMHPPRDPSYAPPPRPPLATVPARRRRRRFLPLVLLVLLLAIGGLVYLGAARTLTGGEFEPPRPLPGARAASPPAANPQPAQPAANPAAPPAAQPSAAPTPNAAPAQWVVANTGGDGVYVRRTPKLDDKVVAWPDNTPMVDLGEQATGDGTTWRKVRDPRGNVGYVPTQYLAPAPSR